MRSNYKRLGEYIREVDVRNTNIEVTELLGVSIQKEMIPSIANTIGSDMSKYKIIKRGQFAYGPVTSRNGDKISIALFNHSTEAIISQAYTSFEVTNTSKLLPEYLMMWFRRPEFNRYARFKSHGSAREIFDWEEMCNVELPIPPIKKQHEIVAEYNAVQKRIDLNNQLIQKLEEMAQTIYKEWFVDCDCVETAYLSQYVEFNPKLDLKRGLVAPYVEMSNLSEFSMCISNMTYRRYLGGSRFQNNDILLARITPCLENGKTAFVMILENDEISAGSTEFIVMRAKESTSPYWVYCLAKSEKFRMYAISSMVGSSGRQRVHEQYLEKYTLPKINKNIMSDFHLLMKPLFEIIRDKSSELKLMEELIEILLSKIATIEK